MGGKGKEWKGVERKREEKSKGEGKRWERKGREWEEKSDGK